jgi:hypothetical protein
MAEDAPQKSGYGKRPIWQWVLIYVVIAAIVYFAIYKLFLAPKGGYSSSGSNYSAPSTQGSSSGY